jgi:hypothetical protein
MIVRKGIGGINVSTVDGLGIRSLTAQTLQSGRVVVVVIQGRSRPALDRGRSVDAQHQDRHLPADDLDRNEDTLGQDHPHPVPNLDKNTVPDQDHPNPHDARSLTPPLPSPGSKTNTHNPSHAVSTLTHHNKMA